MKQQEQRKKTQFSYMWLLAGALALGSFLRFYNIGAQPLWIDEAYSNWFSTKSVLDLWTVVPTYEPHPPLYYTLLKIWSAFGSNEIWMRSLSAVMSIACIPLIFLLGKFLGESMDGSRVGAAAALLFSVYPLHIQYAQETRAYAMLTFAAIMTLCAVLWLMRNPREACRPILGRTQAEAAESCARRGVAAWITAGLAAAFTLWLHNTAALYIFSLFVAVMIWSLREIRFDRYFLGNVLIIALIVALLWGPWIYFLIAQTKEVVGDFWIKKPTVLSVANGISMLLLGNSLPSGFAKAIFKLPAFLLLAVLAAAGLWNIKRRSGPYVALLLLFSIFGPILLELLFSFTVKPIFLEKTLIYVSVPFLISVSAGIMMQRSRKTMIVLLLCVSLIFLKWTSNYYRNSRKEPWDRIAATVAAQAGNDTVLLLPNSLELPFSYYASKMNNKNYRVLGLPQPIEAMPNVPKIGKDDLPGINKEISMSSTIWLITRREDIFDPEGSVFSLLNGSKVLISEWHFGPVALFKFGPQSQH